MLSLSRVGGSGSQPDGGERSWRGYPREPETWQERYGVGLTATDVLNELGVDL